MSGVPRTPSETRHLEGSGTTSTDVAYPVPHDYVLAACRVPRLVGRLLSVFLGQPTHSYPLFSVEPA